MSRIVEWSTDAVEPGERFAYWREAVCDAFLDLGAERVGEPATRPFHGHIALESRPTLDVARIEAGPQRVTRQPSHDGGWCYLNVQRRGLGRTTQGTSTIVTRPGDAVVVRTDRPFEFEFDAEFAQLSVRLPDHVNELVDEPVYVGAGSASGASLAALLSLTEVGSTTTSSDREPPVTEWLDRALIDLVQTTLLARRSPGGDPADRWLEISADIDRHLTDPALSPATSARRVGISIRSLHLSFEDRPLTFSREVRRRRLLLARRRLVDPANTGLRIRDIAADCGFVDVHHFQRIYRQAFGESPGATRRPSDGRTT